jgi:hypothetical protein
MRGAASALTTTSGELTFTMDEGAFYGDLFDPAGPTERARAISTTTRRQRAEPAVRETTDGHHEVRASRTPVCQTSSQCVKSTTPFANCHIAKNAQGATISEVITIFLSP